MSHIVGYHSKQLHEASKSAIYYWSLNSYPRASIPAENPIIPSPHIFEHLDDVHEDHLPTAKQCGVHLELLEAFHALHIKVVGSTDLDKTFGIGEPTKTVYRRKYVAGLKKFVNKEATVKNELFEGQRKMKWPRFLDLAAERFIDWAKKIDAEMAKKASQTDSSGAQCWKSHESSLPFLPPLDVLMFWHAFLLNPSNWINYCRRESLNHLSKVSFPWKRIHEAINSQGTKTHAWAYKLPPATQTWLKGEARIVPDLYAHLVMLGKPIGFTMKATTNKATVGVVSLYPSKDQDSMIKTLCANVSRQKVFVEKMHAHCWIRSPAVAGTLSRAVQRYENFLELFQLYPGKMLVPTLDIDLAWHTSQLSAAEYKASMESRCGRFINHDDKIGKPTLNNGMSETQNIYRIHFAEDYSVCLCWECQAVISALEVWDKEDTLDGMGNSPDLADKLAKDVKEEVDYHRAVESARRRNYTKLPLPKV
ncbi:hypothetical protein FALBO_411 [Fusarium albosuccineum]|uniref:Uncharacterized protein n=1 Tax=Fusarium albosuccineum TaxID=1237068 RepID=A0A8H4PH51_9HYPO|nr:hypothetical protein FALBO_411 [Fusarium albosuccineum]